MKARSPATPRITPTTPATVLTSQLTVSPNLVLVDYLRVPGVTPAVVCRQPTGTESGLGQLSHMSKAGSAPVLRSTGSPNTTLPAVNAQFLRSSTYSAPDGLYSLSRKVTDEPRNREDEKVVSPGPKTLPFNETNPRRKS